MQTVGPILDALFRWLHVLFGIIWIGHLYFFNFVNGPFAATMDGDTKRKVVPELMPRALFWFRWAAVATWAFGLMLLGLVFYHGKLVFDSGIGSWGLAPIVIATCALLWGPLVYDLIAKSGLGKNARMFGIVGFILIGAVLFLMVVWAKFSYRSANIHMGALLGTIMIFNVWLRIWPSQKKIISAIKQGQAPDPAVVALAGGRSRHNTYMSVPLLWTMISAHTAGFSWGDPTRMSWTWFGMFMVIVAVGWHLTWQLYKRAGKVRGM